MWIMLWILAFTGTLWLLWWFITRDAGHQDDAWRPQVCVCTEMILGRFQRARWTPDDKGAQDSGALFAIRCVSCGMAWLAWDSAGRQLLCARDLQWHPKELETANGTKLTAEQIVSWSAKA